MVDDTGFDASQVSVTERIEILEDAVSSLKKIAHTNQITIDHLKFRIDQLENSFIDEVFKSTKTKFDDFRSYLADKIMP